MHVRGRGRTRQSHSASVSQLSHCKQVCFCGLLSATFFPFRGKSWWFCFLKWPPSIILKCSRVPRNKKAVMCLTQKISALDKLCPGVSYSVLAGSSMLMNQQEISNTLSLNRNTHKTKLCIYWSFDKNVVTRGSQEPSPVFPLGVMVPYVLIQCSQRHYRT